MLYQMNDLISVMAPAVHDVLKRHYTRVLEELWPSSVLTQLPAA